MVRRCRWASGAGSMYLYEDLEEYAIEVSDGRYASHRIPIFLTPFRDLAEAVQSYSCVLRTRRRVLCEIHVNRDTSSLKRPL